MQDCAAGHAREHDEEENDPFHDLVQALSDVLGPSSGLDSEEVDPADIQQLMRSYVSKESEWIQYAFSDPSKHYTRNLVDEGNGKSNLVPTIHMLLRDDSDICSSSWYGTQARVPPFTITLMHIV